MANFYVKNCAARSAYLYVRIAALLVFSLNFTHLKALLAIRQVVGSRWQKKRRLGGTGFSIPKLPTANCQLPTQSGFTLIEVLLSFALVSILSAGIVFSYNGFINNTVIKDTSWQVVSLFREAQGNAMGQVEGTQDWGVAIDSTNQVFKMYKTNTSTIKRTLQLTSGVTITSYSFPSQTCASPCDVRFNRDGNPRLPGGTPSGALQGEGSIILEKDGAAKTIRINQRGRIDHN